MYTMLDDDKRQQWSLITAEVLTMVPYMRDIIANIKPIYTDQENFIAGIDKHWRCALSSEFFRLSLSEQCGVTVHEALHCVNNHFSRALILHGIMTDRDNVAADLEINTTLKHHLFLKLPENVLFPDTFNLPEFQSYEYYYEHLPKSKTVEIVLKDLLDDGDSDDITSAGMPEMSNAEKVTARNNTLKRATEYQKSIGNVEGLRNNILQLVIKNLTPAKVDWRTKLSDCLSKSRYAVANHKTNYSYRKVNRRLGNKDIGPGMLSYKPKVMLGIDVSGSVSEDEHLSMLTEIDDIIRQQSHSVEIFAMDVEVDKIQTVSNVNQIKLFEGGGTALECGFKYVKELPKSKRPDIFIVMTDGENYWDRAKEYILSGMKYIVLSTQSSKFLEDVDFAEVIVID